jgi:putative membrane protein
VRLLRRLLLVWACNVAALFVASAFIDGVDYARRFWVLVLAAAVFSVVNWLVKPIVKVLAFPLVIVTLGAGLFLVNLLMLYITTWIVGPFRLDSLAAAIWATIVVWAVNAVLQLVLRPRRKRR